jgi:hypothetical protein
MSMFAFALLLLGALAGGFVSGLAGVPFGTMLVAYADPGAFKLGVGALLLIFPAALYFNRRPMAFSFGIRGRPGLEQFRFALGRRSIGAS